MNTEFASMDDMLASLNENDAAGDALPRLFPLGRIDAELHAMKHGSLFVTERDFAPPRLPWDEEPLSIPDESIDLTLIDPGYAEPSSPPPSDSDSGHSSPSEPSLVEPAGASPEPEHLGRNFSEDNLYPWASRASTPSSTSDSNRSLYPTSTPSFGTSSVASSRQSSPSTFSSTSERVRACRRQKLDDGDWYPSSSPGLSRGGRKNAKKTRGSSSPYDSATPPQKRKQQKKATPVIPRGEEAYSTFTSSSHDQYRCPSFDCSLRFATMHDAVAHAEVERNNGCPSHRLRRVVRCPLRYCSHQSPFGTMERHIVRVDHEPERWMCKTCGGGFGRESSLKRHEATCRG